MKKAYVVLPILLIALVGMSCLVATASPNLDKDDERSTPNGYAEAIVTGSWSLFGHPYYQTHHQAKTSPSNLTGTAIFTGWNKSGGVVYNVTVNFVGSYSYDAPYYNVVWTAQTVCIVVGETAVASIGPHGSL